MAGVAFETAVTGPASYSTGGFTWASGLSTVENANIGVTTPGANLGQVEFDLSYSGGTVTIKVMRRNYDKLTALGDLTNLPTGVSAATVKDQTYDTVSHTHAIDHDHAATPASTTQANKGGANPTTLAASANFTTHTHTLNLPNHVQNAVNESAHTHTWNNIYEHQHTITNTSTNATMTELTNATDLSGTTFMIFAVGTE